MVTRHQLAGLASRIEALAQAMVPPVKVNRIIRLVPVGTPPTRPEPGQRIIRLTLGKDPSHSRRQRGRSAGRWDCTSSKTPSRNARRTGFGT